MGVIFPLVVSLSNYERGFSALVAHHGGMIPGETPSLRLLKPQPLRLTAAQFSNRGDPT